MNCNTTHYRANSSSVPGDPTSGSARADDRVPQWARQAVWYQIFPERFANGDPSNDPTVADFGQTGDVYPYVPPPSGWKTHPWTSDWYKLQPWERDAKGGFYTAVFQRRYGGDMQGILDRLDYLHKLGVTGLYLTPIFESPSLHKYDATYYHHVDNNFGPDPQGDKKIWASEDPTDPATWKWTAADKLLLKLIGECHRRGMRIILDGVFNHVGSTFWAFRDLKARKEQSTYKDWFTVRKYEPFEYEGWFSVKDLPEIRENDNGPVAESFRRHVRAMVRRWMDPDGDGDPSDGIDGWRLDAAQQVALPFWRQFRAWVKEINPEAYLTGEIWYEDYTKGKMWNAAPWLDGRAFDGVMNYRFAQAVQKFAIGGSDPIDAGQFAELFTKVLGDYGPEHLQACMSLIDSHDTDRLASQIVNSQRPYNAAIGPKDNADYIIRRPNGVVRARQRMIAAMQMTLPGAPMIYYGDEAGMWGGTDPDCRKPMVWPEMTYEDEAHDPRGRERAADSVAFDQTLFDFYAKVIATRKANPVLALGQVEFVKVDDPAGRVLAYQRWLNGSRVCVVHNNSEVAKTVELGPQPWLGKDGVVLRDLLTDRTVRASGGPLRVEMQPYQSLILAVQPRGAP